MPVTDSLRRPLAAALLATAAAASAVVATIAQAAPAASPQALRLTAIGTYASGQFDQSAAEIVAHDPRTQRLFVVNASSGRIDVLDARVPTQPTKLFEIDLSAYGATVNSVAVHQGLVAAAVENVVKTSPGQAVFLDADGQVLAAVRVGALPDMITFTPDGRHALVANEGEPNADYSIDPEGSVSIVDLPSQIRSLSASHVRTADFRAFDKASLEPGIRITGPNASVAQDLEPEYITVSGDSRTAWVALQEANAFAVLDIASGRFTALRSAGVKDHLRPGNELDVSNADGAIRIARWPVYGLPMPDAIASYEVGGRTYIVSANEGDAREYDGYADVRRFRALSGETPPCDNARLQSFFATNPLAITTLDQLRDNANLGRLNLVSTEGLRADGSCYEGLYAFGTRSFSIYDAQLDLVYDSGADFERITAAVDPANFNANNDDNDSFDARSDDKGPEPEGVTVAQLWGRHFAFIGLERVGGVMVYDVSNPRAPSFVQYLNHRDFAQDAESPQALDLGPEGLIVIEAARSPIPGVPLLVVANEVSGTTTIYRIDRERRVGR
jgi:DNA-binding beta-propeller fold protein YncE